MGTPVHIPDEVMAGLGKRLVDTYGQPQPPEPPEPVEGMAGVFVTEHDMERARLRMTLPDWAGVYQAHHRRAEGFMDDVPRPFKSDNFEQMVFGWTVTNPPQNSLRVATSMFERESDKMRTLALEFALTDEAKYAEKCVEFLMEWAENHTPVNMYDPGFDINFRDTSLQHSPSTIKHMTHGYESSRPWDLALNSMFQCYGVINAADSLMLLQKAGWQLQDTEERQIRDWIRAITDAVNAGFHSWTKWADPRPTSPSWTRYRTDNHLSWSQAALLAAGIAMEDGALINYVLRGGEWEDPRDGTYANPSYTQDVIDRAIESSSAEPEDEGRVYEEKINRGVGYAIYHMLAMVLVAQAAKLHAPNVEVYHFYGDDGGGIENALDRYAERVLEPGANFQPYFLYELGIVEWPSKQRYRDVINASNRGIHYMQAIGPYAFLLGQDA